MPALGCSVTYRQAGQWQGGFQGEVTVTNRGTVTGRSWTETLTFADGQTVSQSWGATHMQSGAEVLKCTGRGVWERRGEKRPA